MPAQRPQPHSENHGSEVPSIALLIAVLLIPAWIVTLRRKDAWPFSCYPMFSSLMFPETLGVYRIALEHSDGSLRWWNPHFYKLQGTLGKRLVSAALARRSGEVERIVQLVRSSTSEDSNLEQARSLCVVLLQCQTAGDEIKIIDNVVLRIRLAASGDCAR